MSVQNMNKKNMKDLCSWILCKCCQNYIFWSTRYNLTFNVGYLSKVQKLFVTYRLLVTRVYIALFGNGKILFNT